MGNVFRLPKTTQEKSKSVVVLKNNPNCIKKSTAKTSDEVIDDIIDRYMKNELINNPAIPDWVERKIYKNILKLSIGILKDTFNNTELEFMGHSIIVQIKPKTD